MIELVIEVDESKEDYLLRRTIKELSPSKDEICRLSYELQKILLILSSREWPEDIVFHHQEPDSEDNHKD